MPGLYFLHRLQTVLYAPTYKHPCLIWLDIQFVLLEVRFQACHRKVVFCRIFDSLRLKFVLYAQFICSIYNQQRIDKKCEKVMTGK